MGPHEGSLGPHAFTEPSWGNKAKQRVHLSVLVRLSGPGCSSFGDPRTISRCKSWTWKDGGPKRCEMYGEVPGTHGKAAGGLQQVGPNGHFAVHEVGPVGFNNQHFWHPGSVT